MYSLVSVKFRRSKLVLYTTFVIVRLVVLLGAALVVALEERRARLVFTAHHGVRVVSCSNYPHI